MVVVLLLAIILSSRSKESENEFSKDVMSPSHPLNATYIIKDREVALSEGINEEDISGSKIATTVWDEPISRDMEGSAQGFWAVVLSQDSEESVNSFYIAGCVGGGLSCIGTNSILLGEDVAVQSVEIETDGTVVVNYLDSEEALIAQQPSAIVRKFTIIGDTLKEVMGG